MKVEYEVIDFYESDFGERLFFGTEMACNRYAETYREETDGECDLVVRESKRVLSMSKTEKEKIKRALQKKDMVKIDQITRINKWSDGFTLENFDGEPGVTCGYWNVVTFTRNVEDILDLY